MAILAGTKSPCVTAFVSIMGKASHKGNLGLDWERKGVEIHKRDTPQGYSKAVKHFEIPYSFVEDLQLFDPHLKI